MPVDTAKKTPVNFDELPDSAHLRDKQIVAPIGPLPISRATLWNWAREGRIAKPTKLSPRVTVWKVGDIRAFLASQANA